MNLAISAVCGFKVEFQRRPCVLSLNVHPVQRQSMRATHVGLIPDLHRAAWIEIVGGQDSVRAMVFVAARKDPHAAGRERRNDRVSGESGKGRTVPGEAEALVAG